LRFLVVFVLFLVSLFASESKVSLQLQWKNQFQFAGYYIAKEKGFYKEAGLDVEIKEYKSGVDVVADVVSGKSTYGIGRSSILIDRNSKKPVVLFGALFQRSPLVLISTKPDIKEITDLVGKKVMITEDAKNSASILAMLLSEGVNSTSYTTQKHSFNYMDLINQKTDSMASYTTNEPYLLKAKNVDFKIFDPKDYGFDFYEDILFTSEKEMHENPQRVKAFRDASIKGWLWALNNIQKSAKIIYDKYNTQNKTLQALIYEAEETKRLSLIKGIPFFSIDKDKVRSISRVFQIKGLMSGKCNVDNFVYDYKQKVKIGVLAKRGDDATIKRWSPMAEYLEKELRYYDFDIVPLDFEKLQQSVRDEEVDFIITNTMYYVILEARYGISRIATLLNSGIDSKDTLKFFGGVIFTKKTNNSINTIDDIKNKTFGAVSELSFGGWIMAYEELKNSGIDKNDFKLKFLGTHDAVVEAVLDGSVDVGTVRTDTLERMQKEGKIKLDDFKVLSLNEYDGFPYLVSTKLYPEWPISKLPHTPDNLANKLLAQLVSYDVDSSDLETLHIKGWTVPLDYSSVHKTLRELRIEPYENIDVSLEDIIEKYSFVLFLAALFAISLLVGIIYYKRYNKALDLAVKEKTKELIQANTKLKVLANTDFLTGISNRAHFMRLAKKYLQVAKRNGEKFQILSLDLDFFKKINDTYGHQAGDCVLKKFAQKTSELIRESDLFGRTGGEEFCILLQNTSEDGAKMFAKRICESIEDMHMDCDGHILTITVSIGVAPYDGEDMIDEIIKKSDIALYQAKENGRNQVIFYSKD
jgi:diguanylate cyclase (GGDEF)-like protein